MGEPKGICKKCGRTFLTMPADGRDHYLPPHKREGQPCMGRVVKADPTNG